MPGLDFHQCCNKRKFDFTTLCFGELSQAKVCILDQKQIELQKSCEFGSTSKHITEHSIGKLFLHVMIYLIGILLLYYSMYFIFLNKCICLFYALVFFKLGCAS